MGAGRAQATREGRRGIIEPKEARPRGRAPGAADWEPYQSRGRRVEIGRGNEEGFGELYARGLRAADRAYQHAKPKVMSII